MAFSALTRMKSTGVGSSNQSTLPIATTVVGASVGDLVIVFVAYGLGSTPTLACADTKSNTWTLGGRCDKNTGNTPHSAIFWSVLTVALTTGDTITITPGTNFNFPQGMAYKSTPTAGRTVAADGTNNGSGVSTSPSSGSITTTGTDELLVGAVCTGNPQALTAGSGWTLVDSNSAVGANKRIDGEYRIESTATSYTADGTITSADWADVIVAFSATAAGNPPVNTVAPVASGTATVGQALSTTNGTWTGDATINFTYQWQRDTAGNLSFSNIGSATSSTYTLVDADDGNKVRCVVTGTNSAGNSSGNSNALGLVVEAGVPTISVAPAVTGTTTVGQTLTTDHGTWTGMGGSVATYAYQWQRDVAGSGSYSNIGSATSTTYVLVDADDACHIKCLVTATNDVGAGTAAASNIVGTVIEPDPTNSVVPALGGVNATSYSVITSTTGTWAHMGGSNPTYTYQWKDSATSGGAYANISGATSSSYTVEVAEETKFLKCFVTAHNTGSPATANTVASNQVAAGTPPSSGSAQHGSSQSFITIISGAAD